MGQMNLCAHVPALGMLAMEWEGHPTGLRLLLEEGRCADKGCGEAGIHKSLVVLVMEWGGTSDWITTSVRKGEAGGQRLEVQATKIYTGGCIVQACSFNMPLLQVVKNLGQLSVCFGIAARKKQTHRWYLGIGISRKRLVWQKETGPAPRFLPCFRSADVAGVAIGAGRVSVRGRRLSGWGLSIGGDRGAARLSVYDSLLQFRLESCRKRTRWRSETSQQGSSA